MGAALAPGIAGVNHRHKHSVRHVRIFGLVGLLHPPQTTPGASTYRNLQNAGLAPPKGQAQGKAVFRGAQGTRPNMQRPVNQRPSLATGRQIDGKLDIVDRK